MIEFTEGQRRTIASGVTVVSLAVTIAFVAFIAFLGLKALALVSPAVVPVIAGLFLAMFFKPYYRWWKGVVRNPSLAMVVMLLTVLVPLGLIAWYAGAVIIDQIVNLIHQGPALYAQVTEYLRTTFPKLRSLFDQFGISLDSYGDIYAKYGISAIKAGASALKCLSGILTALLTLIFFVFFLMSKDWRGRDIVGELTFLKRETREFLAVQIDVFCEIVVSFFQRQIVICLVEGVLYGAGFALVGLPYGFLIGFTLGCLNLIPLFGTVVCMPVAIPLAYFVHGGSLTRLMLVLAVWATGQILDGYFITPKIQGNRTGLGWAGVIFSFIFWGTVLGPLLGLLLAIPLSAFFVVFWRTIKARYIRPVV